jgi:hypothetical protein
MIEMTATGQPFGITQTGPVPTHTATPSSRPTGPPTVSVQMPFLVKTKDGKLIQVVTVQQGGGYMTVAQDGQKPKNARFVTVYVDVLAYEKINDPSAPLAAISPEDFFMVDGSGKRFDVWNGNSLHAVPKPEDRLQPTKLPNPHDRARGWIGLDVPQGALKLGYITPNGVLSPAVSRPVFGYWSLPLT